MRGHAENRARVPGEDPDAAGVQSRPLPSRPIEAICLPSGEKTRAGWRSLSGAGPFHRPGGVGLDEPDGPSSTATARRSPFIVQGDGETGPPSPSRAAISPHLRVPDAGLPAGRARGESLPSRLKASSGRIRRRIASSRIDFASFTSQSVTAPFSEALASRLPSFGENRTR